MATSAAPSSPKGPSPTRRKSHAQSVEWSTLMKRGFDLSVMKGLEYLEDPEVPPYVKIRVMEFFAKHRPDAAPVDLGAGEPSTRDRFLTLMDDMSALDDAAGDEHAPPAA